MGSRWELKINGNVYNLKFMLKAKRNMWDNKFQYRVYSIFGLMITFLLVGNITYTDARGKSSATISSKQHELRDIKSLPTIQLESPMKICMNLNLLKVIVAPGMKYSSINMNIYIELLSMQKKRNKK